MKIYLLILTLAVAALILNASMIHVKSDIPDELHNANAMWIEPSIVDFAGGSLGDRFNVTLWLNLKVSCVGWQFRMLYDKSLLSATRAGYTAGSKSDFFRNITTMPVLPVFGVENDTHNFVMHGEVWLLGPHRSPGYGCLSWVEFTVMAEPTEGQEIFSAIDISTYYHPPTGLTYAIDSDLNDIPLMVYDCIYLSWTPSPTRRVHNLNTTLSYETIQEAIGANATLNGHTIFVEEGIYYEHVVVNKSLSLLGERRDGTIIDGNGTETVVFVTVSNVTISNFTIQYSGFSGWGNAGIHLYWSSNSCIANNIIANNGDGIFLSYSHNDNVIANNSICSNALGIRLYYSDNNTLANNNVYSNQNGIYFERSARNTLADNNMTSNGRRNFRIDGYSLPDYVQNIDTSNKVNDKPVYYLVNQNNIIVDPSTFPDVGYLAIINSTNIVVEHLTLTENGQGILLAYATNSIIENVSTLNNEIGIHLYQSNNVTLVGNNISNNGWGGIYLHRSDNSTVVANDVSNNVYGVVLRNAAANTLSGNTVSYSSEGIRMEFSNENTFIGNTVFADDWTLFLWESSNNTIFHNNFVPRHRQISSHHSTNIWDAGYPSDGNYWSDYNGTDPDHDGIGNTPYEIDANNTDRYPLMGMFYGFNTEYGYAVSFVSNSSISNFAFNLLEISPSEATLVFNVTGDTGTSGFVRVCIPKFLLSGSYIVRFDGEIITNPQVNELPCSNETYTYFYIHYTHTQHTIVISGTTMIPEFHSFMILPLLILAIILTLVAYRRKRARVEGLAQA